MKSSLFALLFCLFGPCLTGSREILKKMMDRYSGKWYHSFVFDQTTEFYRNDSLTGTRTWYEALKFPDRFRIDFGEPDSGSALIIKGDSSYYFSKTKLRSVSFDEDQLTFLLGGMYFYSLDQVIRKLQGLGFDLDKFHEDSQEGRPVFVIGARKGEMEVNQLWIDQEDLYVVRTVRVHANGIREEGFLGGQQRFGGGWSETKCRFYSNDKLIQVETYHHCMQDIPLDDRLFDPSVFRKWH
jgi:hypothetical protein